MHRLVRRHVAAHGRRHHRTIARLHSTCLSPRAVKQRGAAVAFAGTRQTFDEDGEAEAQDSGEGLSEDVSAMMKALKSTADIESMYDELIDEGEEEDAAQQEARDKLRQAGVQVKVRGRGRVWVRSTAGPCHVFAFPLASPPQFRPIVVPRSLCPAPLSAPFTVTSHDVTKRANRVDYARKSWHLAQAQRGCETFSRGEDRRTRGACRRCVFGPPWGSGARRRSRPLLGPHPQHPPPLHAFSSQAPRAGRTVSVLQVAIGPRMTDKRSILLPF